MDRTTAFLNRNGAFDHIPSAATSPFLRREKPDLGPACDDVAPELQGLQMFDPLWIAV
jgi:hypothetical protein